MMRLIGVSATKGRGTLFHVPLIRWLASLKIMRRERQWLGRMPVGFDSLALGDAAHPETRSPGKGEDYRVSYGFHRLTEGSR